MDHRGIVRRARMVLAGAAVVWAGASYASLPPALAQAVARGAHIFKEDSFGSQVRPVASAASAFANMGHSHRRVGFMTCAACHVGGGLTRGQLPDGRSIPSLRNAAAVFPRYSAKSHRIVTLEDQIRHCVKDGIKGRPPSYRGATMVDLVSYLKSLASGRRMRIGGAFH
jgi:thiosulfate dehydrogenase